MTKNIRKSGMLGIVALITVSLMCGGVLGAENHTVHFVTYDDSTLELINATVTVSYLGNGTEHSNFTTENGVANVTLPSGNFTFEAVNGSDECSSIIILTDDQGNITASCGLAPVPITNGTLDFIFEAPVTFGLISIVAIMGIMVIYLYSQKK